MTFLVTSNPIGALRLRRLSFALAFRAEILRIDSDERIYYGFRYEIEHERYFNFGVEHPFRMEPRDALAYLMDTKARWEYFFPNLGVHCHSCIDKCRDATLHSLVIETIIKIGFEGLKISTKSNGSLLGFKRILVLRIIVLAQ